MSDLKLSYSSSNLLKGCQQRFYYYKSNQDKDSDYEDNTDALTIGTSFHHVLEMSKHEKPEKITDLLDECVDQFNLQIDKVPLVHAMVIKYLRLHKEVGLECVTCEIEIGNDDFLGFVDAILKDPKTGKWWIVDLKTAARIYGSLYQKLKTDTQLNLYAYFAPMIAKELKLKPEDFAGCRYRVTTKSVIKQRKTEEYVDYVMRLVKTIKTYDIVIDKKYLKPEETYKRHMIDHELSEKIQTGQVPPVKNFNYCDAFFRPCPYFSNCHGGLYTETARDLQINEL